MGTGNRHEPDQHENDRQAVDAQEVRAAQSRKVLQNLRRVYRAIQAHSRWVEKQCGVSAAQLWAMWELHTQAGLRVSELSSILSIQQSTASNMLDKLEEKGFIRRSRGGPDQRVVRLYLTDDGTALLARAPQPAQGALTYALEQLSDSDLVELQTGLDSLMTAMEYAEKGAGLEPMPEDSDD